MRVITRLIVITIVAIAPFFITYPVVSVAQSAPSSGVNYLKDIRPLLNKRCVVCHSCYNSPCQLKLSSFEGFARGATKKEVYNSKRLFSVEPTRLFQDAETVDEWRTKGFHSVGEKPDGVSREKSLVEQILDQKKQHDRTACSADYSDDCNWFRPEEDTLSCAATGAEMDAYLHKHPNRGMPYGFPPLTTAEFQKITSWLQGGAPGPGEQEMQKMKSIHPDDVDDVLKWESFFNIRDPKYRMTARYLYEHLFLAHITFSNSGDAFYELVRSSTPPGKPVKILPTLRPYDKPSTATFYYRFRRIHSTIVHKTHMVFTLSDTKLERIKELFIQPQWLRKPHWVGFDKRRSANPFAVFAQIPPSSRYRFLLDNAQYIIMTFIRGPVCKGQVALNVVRDHFWLLFMDPHYDLAASHPGFLQDNLRLTRIPTEQGSFFSLFKSWMIPRYERYAAQYVRERQKYYYRQYGYRGLDHRAIWTGNQPGDTPMLTVFRHFDSASVHDGPKGDLPRTVWVLDYPLLERIYYALVAGFDVFGSTGHQLAVRLYMDNLRQEGETYFLDFLPKNERAGLMKEWYGGINLQKIKYTPSKMETSVSYTGSDYKREFLEYLVRSHLRPWERYSFDANYRLKQDQTPEIPDDYNFEQDYIRGFQAVSAPGSTFFKYVHDHNANLAYIRIRVPGGQDRFVSMVIHRWHDDVRTLSRERDKLDPGKDEVDFFEEFIGSYPNYFFDIELSQLPDFLEALHTYDGTPGAELNMLRFGVNRADPEFWQVYDDFQQEFLDRDQVTSGLFDLNRYYYLAIDPVAGAADLTSSVSAE